MTQLSQAHTQTHKMIYQKQKGAISLILVILILSVFLVISLAMAVLLLKQITMSIQAGDSVGAYQAADSGIEYALYQKYEKGAKSADDFFEVACASKNWSAVGNDGAFCLEIIVEEGQIVGLKSIGKFRNVRRAIEVGLSQD